MRRIAVSTSGSGTSAMVPLNIQNIEFKAAVGCIVTGTVNYTVQHTYDDVYSSTFSAATATWFNDANAALVGATANQEGTYAYPYTALQIKQNSGTGSVQMVVIEQGIQ